MSDKHMIETPSANKGFLIVALIVTFIIGICFCAKVNPGVAHCMDSLVGLDLTDYTNQTIFDTFAYGRSIHILAMLLLGFGFLMVFLRDHGHTSIAATLLAVSISIPVYMLIKCFMGEGHEILDITPFLFAEFAAASLLIAIGAPLGRLTLEQFMAMSFLFTFVYFANEYLVLDSGLFAGFQDTGGSVLIHAFGAYFGMGLVATTAKKFIDGPQPTESHVSNQFCLVGSLVLWVFWPSFTSAVASPERAVLTAVNTVFALCGSTIATIIVSKLINGKVSVEDMANAALAGGVAIGSTCDIASPGFAMIVGILAGILSVVGYNIIAPRWQKLIGGNDTCGVHNLHGMPGLLGGFSAIVICGHAGVQILAMVVTVVIAFIGGRIVGAIIGLMKQKAVPYSDEDDFLLHE